MSNSVQVRNKRGDCDYKYFGITVPYTGEWVDISPDKLLMLSELLSNDVKTGKIEMRGSLETLPTKQASLFEVEVEVNEEPSEMTRKWVREQFMKRLSLVSSKVLSKFVSDGLYDNLDLLRDIARMTTDKETRKIVTERLKYLKERTGNNDEKEGSDSI